jgi:Ribonuclease G/E
MGERDEEPVCEKCEGTGYIYDKKNSYLLRSPGFVKYKDTNKPCPACSEKKPEKEKRLMVEEQSLLEVALEKNTSLREAINNYCSLRCESHGSPHCSSRCPLFDIP